jgi:ribosomal protein S12 methylthiotransferase accessory factor YcaO
MDVPDQVVTVVLSAAAGVLAWLATNWVGKPIVNGRDKRLKALQAAEQNAFVGSGASDERRRAAKAALNEAASALRSISRGQWPVRL